MKRFNFWNTFKIATVRGSFLVTPLIGISLEKRAECLNMGVYIQLGWICWLIEIRIK